MLVCTAMYVVTGIIVYTTSVTFLVVHLVPF